MVGVRAGAGHTPAESAVWLRELSPNLETLLLPLLLPLTWSGWWRRAQRGTSQITVPSLTRPRLVLAQGANWLRGISSSDIDCETLQKIGYKNAEKLLNWTTAV